MPLIRNVTSSLKGLDRFCYTLLVIWIVYVESCQSQKLRGGHHTCRSDQEGKFVPVRMPRDLTVDCRCTKGILESCQYPAVFCQKRLEGCHFVQQSKNGLCQEVCRQCVRNGVKYDSGKTWVDAKNRCLVNHCFSGVITQSKIQCPPVMCTNPVRRSGECCPSCPRCVRALQPFEEGETKPDPLDPCNECTCKRGELTCIRKSCPVLPCKDSLIKFVTGQCCPICARRHEASPMINKKMCLFKDRVYYPNSQVPTSDACSNCTCSKTLTVECKRKTCPPAACAKSRQIVAPGECCPSCPATVAKALPAETPTHCTYQGSKHEDGAQWKDRCNVCSCNKGQTKCEMTTCPPLSCPGSAVLVQKEGQCCPQCEFQEGVCTVFGDPHYKTFDGSIFNFQGSCKYLLARDCENGQGGNHTFSIRITNDARDSLAFSWLRTITVRLNGVKVSLMQKMKVKVDGKRVTLPFIKLGSLSVMKDGYRVILRTNAGKQTG